MALRACAVPLCVGLVLAAGSVANGDELGWWTFGPIVESNFGSVADMDGLEFTPQATITVTALGWYDDTVLTANGLAESHQVGIWDVNTLQLLASTTVPAGTSTAKINTFRFVDLPQPLELTAGRECVVAGLGGTEADPNHLVTPGDDLLTHPGITTGDWRSGGTSFEFPASVIPASTRQMGPNLLFIPEPSSLTLLAVGAIALCRRRSGG